LSGTPFVPRYPKLPLHLKRQLDAITPSVDGDLKYYPCLVRLNNGIETDRAYFVAEGPYIKKWVLYPSQDRHKVEILSSEVASLVESPSRLPPPFANQLYQAGESGMGYTVFTVIFSDDFRQAYLTGNAVDFVDYPEGKTSQDVVAVIPHQGRDDARCRDAPNYSWCIYSE
jgi:hypothetical protein